MDEPSDFLAVIRRELESWLAPEDTSKEAKLLRRWDKKRRGLRSHTQSFVVVNGFLVLLWLTLGVTTGAWFPWFLFPVLGWGMGLSMHVLGHRSWVNDRAPELQRARERLGLAAPRPGESSWDRLRTRADVAVTEALAGLEASGTPLDVGPMRAQLEEGKAQLEDLLITGRAIDEALSGVAPGGVPSVDNAISEVETQHARALEAGTRGALEQKRALLISRRAKLESLRAEQRRIEATAEGFVIAAENMRLDALRIGKGGKTHGEVTSALERLEDELEVLEAVHRELESL